MSQSLEKCRLCLNDCIQYKSIFEMEKNTQFAQMVMGLTRIKIRQNDGLPSKICSKCILRLKTTYALKLIWERQNDVLQKNITQKKNISLTSHSETEKVSPSQEHLSTQMSSNNIDKPSSDNHNQTQIDQSLKQSNHINVVVSGECSKDLPKSVSITYPPNTCTKNSNEESKNSNSTDNSKIYNCPYCKEQFELYISYKKHLIKCVIRNNSKKSMKSMFGRQMVSQINTDFTCLVCHKKYKRNSTLTKHLINVHRIMQV